MVYSDFYFQSRSKLPFFLVGLAALSIFSFSLFFFGANSTPTRASKKTVKRHEVVNISANQAGIFWQSDVKEVGWIVYGDSENNINTLVFDDRDVESKKGTYEYHYAYLKGLERDKTYYYKIVANNELVAGADGRPFSFKTAKNSPTAQTIKPAYGKVLNPNGSPTQNAIVLYFYEGATPLATVTKTTGEWLIPLQNIYDKKTGEFVTVSENQKVTIEVLSEEQLVSTVTAVVKKTNPMSQSIIAGKSYNLPSEDENVLPAFTQNTTATLNAIDIIYPREGAVIPAVRPLIKGVALPEKQVKLTINARPVFETTVSTNAKGEWKADVARELQAGNYTLSLSTVNDKNRAVNVTRKFSIAKSGEQVLGDATGSASTTVTPTIQPTRAASPTIVATATATIAATGLPNTALSPTPSTLPDTGFSPTVFMYLSIFLIVLGTGFLVVF